MNAKFKGILVLACICMLAMAVSPVSAGTGYDENTNKALTGSNGSGGGAGNTGEKPVQNFNTKPVENYNTKPVQYRQNESVENYNTKPVQYRQNEPVDNYNTKPVEYCQNKPVEYCNCQTVANCENKPVSEYRMPEISEADFSAKDELSKNKDEAYGKYPDDEITTSTENGNNNDLRKDAISDYLDKKWEEIKAMIIEAILSGKI